MFRLLLTDDEGTLQAEWYVPQAMSGHSLVARLDDLPFTYPTPEDCAAEWPEQAAAESDGA